MMLKGLTGMFDYEEWQRIVEKEVTFNDDKELHLQLFDHYKRIKKESLDNCTVPDNTMKPNHHFLFKAIIEFAINETCNLMCRAIAHPIKGFIGIDKYKIGVKTTVRQDRSDNFNDYDCIFTQIDERGLRQINNLISSNTDLVLVNSSEWKSQAINGLNFDDFSFDNFRNKIGNWLYF